MTDATKLNIANYQPKGSMCAACAKKKSDCSKLPFNKMPVIERYHGGIVVRCLEFKRDWKK